MRETRLERAALGVTVGIVCLSLALHARPAAAWTASFPDGAASTVGVDRHGDVVVGGTVRSTTAPEQFDGVVVELSAAGGAEAWRWTVSGGAIERLVVDAAGDVIAAGGLRADGAVVKLSGVSGTEVWRYVLPGAVFHAVAIDASGDVVAAGALRLPPRVPTFAFVVVRLDGINGAERWRRELPTSEEGAMDAAFAVGLQRGRLRVRRRHVSASASERVHGAQAGWPHRRGAVATGASRIGKRQRRVQCARSGWIG
jgi:outer membrane protein assembly factor BamB